MPRIRRISKEGLRRENDPLLLVLISLTTGSKHGHALIDDIEQFARLRFGPGTLYGAIGRLEQSRLIEALEPEGRRRPYRVTGAGVRSLRAVLDSMEEL